MSAPTMPGTGGRDGEHPVVVRAFLDEPLSRWLWLVKWILLIPHFVVLVFLWIAFVLVTVVAFFAVLFTGRYPRSLFAFNLGVLRWGWRVGYYGYGALGTDRYPPFTLHHVPDYPAMLDVAYPQRLSRGLVLVKWWLLAIPHYMLLTLFVGGAGYTAYQTANGDWEVVDSPGLLGLCVFFAGVALLFTARYPRGLYDLVTGLNRWVLRVVAYAALMTDVYPPFRLDQGGEEPATPHGPAPTEPAAATAGTPAAAAAGGSGGTESPHWYAQSTQRGSAGPIIALVVGLLLFLPGVALAAVGTGGLWLEGQRDPAGYVASPTRVLTSDSAALTVEDVELHLDRGPGTVLTDDFGTVRVRATSTDSRPLFLGIAPDADVDRWLGGVAHDTIRDFGDEGTVRYLHRDGTAPLAAPVQQNFWTASASGTGPQELVWPARTGRWALVVARPDGTPGVSARVDVGARIPDLTGFATGMLVAGLLLLLLAAALIVLGAAGIGRRTGGPPSGPAGQPAYPAPPPPEPAATATDPAQPARS